MQRVSLQSVRTVLSYALSAVQRCVDHEHVRRMVDDQIQEVLRTGGLSLLQSITVATPRRDAATSTSTSSSSPTSSSARPVVLDGQHRMLAFAEMRRARPDMQTLIDGTTIPVVEYLVRDAAEAASYYNRINQHRPVHPFEIHDGDVWALFGKPFVQWFCATYAPYVRRGARVRTTRCPHIGEEQLKSELLARRRLIDACERDPARVCEAVRAVNEVLRAVAHARRVTSSSSSAQEDPCTHMLCVCDGGDGPPEAGIHRRLSECEEKAARTSDPARACCYLGAFRRFEWLDLALHACTTKQPPDALVCSMLLASTDARGSSGGANRTRPRTLIPHVVRERVWERVNSPHATLGACYTCGEALRFRDMECGHVVPRAFGGADDVSNLLPVCRRCNRDMGVQDMRDYRQRIRSAMDVEMDVDVNVDVDGNDKNAIAS